MIRTFALLMLLLVSAPVAAQAPPQRVWITEFATTRVEAAAPIANLPSSVRQPVIDLSSGTAKRSATFNSGTRYIRVICEVQCALTSIGNATTSDILLPKLTPEYFGIQGVQAISIIAAP